jgi:uncharacterized protein involved in response to NO
MTRQRALWSRGFRPFFLGAAVFAMLAIAAWFASYRYGLRLEIGVLSPVQWHAHEMIFGYALAVFAGFLLTAAQNWTGVETLRGGALFALFVCWLLARAWMVGGMLLQPLAALADCAFALGLLGAVAVPVLKVRQGRQAPVLVILALLAVAQIVFHAGVLTGRPQWIGLALQAGFYLVLGLMLFIGRRVIPFFTGRGVGYPVELRNRYWNDIVSWLLFPPFLLAEILFRNSKAGAALAAVLFVSNALRVADWYTPGIWKKPLLWSLHVAYAAITLGFLTRALAAVGWAPPQIATHVFALGGIGLITISMMTRVSLGHTGRSVHEAPPLVALFLLTMVLAGLARTLFVALDPGRQVFWVSLSALLWIAAHMLFAAAIGPLLLRPRVEAES